MRIIVSRETGELLEVLEPATAADYAALHKRLEEQVCRAVLQMGLENLNAICEKARKNSETLFT